MHEPSPRHDDPAPEPRVPLLPGSEPDVPGSSPGTTPVPEFAALIELLDDPSPAVWRGVRERLIEAGPRARPALRRAADSARARLRARAREVLSALDREGSVRRLVRYVARADVDLERAFYLVSKLESPTFDARPYAKTLDAMGDEVRRRAEAAGSGLPRLRTLAQYLGAERGFAGDSSDYHHPDNIHLHRALERRRGLPLTLSAIYLFVARRAGILCGAMALPGHVVVTLRGDGESLIVDPFHGGRQLSRRDCMQFLTQHGHAPDPAWLRDASDGVILLRQLRNLMNSYLSRGLSSRAREIRPVLEVLTRSQVRRNLSASSRGERPGPRRPGPGTS